MIIQNHQIHSKQIQAIKGVHLEGIHHQEIILDHQIKIGMQQMYLVRDQAHQAMHFQVEVNQIHFRLLHQQDSVKKRHNSQ